MGTHFLVLCIQQLFPHMKTNTNKLSSRCDVDTLCHFDMEVCTRVHVCYIHTYCYVHVNSCNIGTKWFA